MSQPTDSTTAANRTAVYNSALDEYHAKVASGYFKPATTDTSQHLPDGNAHIANVPAPRIPHPPTSQAALPPPPTATAPVAATAVTTPPTTYSPYGSLPSTPNPRVTLSGHLPNLLPQHNPTLSYGPFPSYQPSPVQPRQDLFVPTPDSLTFAHIFAHVQYLLGLNLPSWISPHIYLLSEALTAEIITIGQKGELGPDGIGSVEDIFMVVGHEYHGREGQWHYMALAAMAPTKLKVLMRGPAFFLDGRNPLENNASMEILRSGFKDVAWQEWKRAGDVNGMGAGGRRYG